MDNYEFNSVIANTRFSTKVIERLRKVFVLGMSQESVSIAENITSTAVSESVQKFKKHYKNFATTQKVDDYYQVTVPQHKLDEVVAAIKQITKGR